MDSHPLFVLVDPSSQGLETLTHAFERDGCRVIGTLDPLAAPEIVRSNHAQLAVIAVRQPEHPAIDLISGLHIHPSTKNLPIVALGPVDFRAAALGAGAFDYLNTPLFVRDVVTIGRLVLLMRQAAAAAETGSALQIRAALADYHGLFHLVRAMAGTGRSGILDMVRNHRKGEVRFCDGAVTTAQTGALQGFPALHQLLLWTEGTISLRLRDVPKRGQFSLSAGDILDECERFLRDYAHVAADVGPANTIYAQDSAEVAPASRVVPNEIGPVARLFDGRRTLAEVIEESPFRIFDTLRIVKQLLDAKALVARAAPAAAPVRMRTRTAAQGSRTTPPDLEAIPDRRGGAGDRRKSSRSQRMIAIGNTPKPIAAAPIPLVVKKTSSAGMVAGEIAPGGGAAGARRQSSPPVSGDEPTIQVKLDGPRMSLDMPVPASVRSKTPPPSAALRQAGVPQAPMRAARTKRHGLAATPTPVFDAIETEFFAREAELYKKETVESFEDLEPGSGVRARHDPPAALGSRRRAPDKK